MRIEISDGTFQRLQGLAVPLIDTVEDVIVRLLDIYDTNKEAEHTQSVLPPSTATQTHVPNFAPQPKRREQLSGFRKELWELVIQKLPPTFSLHDVYKHQEPLVKRRPHVQEMEATIRNAMQRLRDKGYVVFLGRGEYRRID